MSVQTIYRILCDAPLCPAVEISEDRTAPGWRKLHSTEHLDLSRYPANPAPRSRKLSRSDVLHGGFSLLLCPDHHDAFDAHRPQTSGGGPTRSGGNHIVNVGCSCGASLRWTTATTIVAPKTVPSYSPERIWYQHLPTDLRWYATRAVTA